MNFPPGFRRDLLSAAEYSPRFVEFFCYRSIDNATAKLFRTCEIVTGPKLLREEMQRYRLCPAIPQSILKQKTDLRRDVGALLVKLGRPEGLAHQAAEGRLVFLAGHGVAVVGARLAGIAHFELQRAVLLRTALPIHTSLMFRLSSYLNLKTKRRWV